MQYSAVNAANVDLFSSGYGLLVDDGHRDDGDPAVWVSPLVVPAGNK